MKDISYKDDGLYQCTVANHVGYSVCVVEVKVSGGCRQWLVGWEGWMGGSWAVFWSLSRLSLMGLINAYSSAKVSQEALGETCKYEDSSGTCSKLQGANGSGYGFDTRTSKLS